MLAQIEVMEAATGGIPRTARRRAIAQAHTGLRSYNRQRSAFLLTSQAGVQCTLAWCDGGSSPTTTLLTQATATTTISTSGGVGSCVWSSAANAPAPPPTPVPPPPPSASASASRSPTAATVKANALASGERAGGDHAVRTAMVRDMQAEIEAVREASAAKEEELAQLRHEQQVQQREVERKALATLDMPSL